MTRDPLSERVHLNKAEIAATTVSGMAGAGGRRIGRWFGAGNNARHM